MITIKNPDYDENNEKTEENYQIGSLSGHLIQPLSGKSRLKKKLEKY